MKDDALDLNNCTQDSRMSPHDVYSYGVVSSSTLYTLKGAFPATEGYGEIESVHYMTGGEATNSSIVLSRLGVQVKLDGNWLGDDESGKGKICWIVPLPYVFWSITMPRSLSCIAPATNSAALAVR